MRLIGWQAEFRDKGQGETDVLASVSVHGEQQALVFEVKAEMTADKPIPLRYVTQATGQLTRYRGETRFKHHQMRAILVSKSESLEDSAAKAASELTFMRQSTVESVATQAIAAFQRYASIRTRKGLLPKRIECVESLEMSPSLMGFYEVAIHKGRILSDEEVLSVIKRQ